MKKLNRLILLTLILGLLATWWSHAQAPSERLKLMVNGVEIHTLMSDRHNALVGYLETAGQTNALELLRQYRCAYSADLSSSELASTLRILKYLRNSQKDQAVYDLEQHLMQYANLMCNSYGGLEPTNRERVKLESLQQTKDYLVMSPHPEWGTNTEHAITEILRLNTAKKSPLP